MTIWQPLFHPGACSVNVRGLPEVLSWLEGSVNHTSMCKHYKNNDPERLANFSLDVYKDINNITDINAYFNWTEKV